MPGWLWRRTGKLCKRRAKFFSSVKRSNGGAGKRRRHDDGYREPLSRFPTCTRLRRRYCSTACSLVTGRPATSVSAAHTITPSRVRRLCVRRAYFRRRRTRHARSLRRVVTAAAVRFSFSLIFLLFFF